MNWNHYVSASWDTKNRRYTVSVSSRPDYARGSTVVHSEQIDKSVEMNLVATVPIYNRAYAKYREQYGD